MEVVLVAVCISNTVVVVVNTQCFHKMLLASEGFLCDLRLARATLSRPWNP